MSENADFGAEELQRLEQLKGIAFATMALFILVCVAQRVGLYADGSYQFLETLLDPDIDPPNQRFSTRTLTHLPLLVAIWTGRVRIVQLEWAYGIGLFAHFALMMLICAKATASRPALLVFPLASFFLVSANMAFWAFTGSHVMVTAFWSLLFSVTLPEPWSPRWRLLSVVLAVIAMMSFESMLFLGPVLAVAAWRRARLEDRPGFRVAILVVVLCLGGMAIAGISVALRGADHFTKSAFAMHDAAGRWHGMLLLSLAGFVLVATANTKWTGAWRIAASIVAAACAAWVAAITIRPEQFLSVSVQHDVRTFNLWLTLALALVFYLVHAGWVPWKPSAWLRAWRIVVVVGLAQAAWLLPVTRQWEHYLRLFGTEASMPHGIRPYDLSLPAQHEVDGMLVNRFTWGWTVPVLSLLAAPRGRVQTLIDYPTWRDGWSPFPVSDLTSLGGMYRYGFDFEPMAGVTRIPRR